MSVSLNANVIDRITLSSTPDDVTEVILDKKVRHVVIAGYNAAGTARDECKLALDGADDTAIGADYRTILAAEEPVKHAVAGQARNLSGTSIFIGSGTASAIVEVQTSDKPL